MLDDQSANLTNYMFWKKDLLQFMIVFVHDNYAKNFFDGIHSSIYIVHPLLARLVVVVIKAS